MFPNLLISSVYAKKDGDALKAMTSFYKEVDLPVVKGVPSSNAIAFNLPTSLEHGVTRVDIYNITKQKFEFYDFTEKKEKNLIAIIRNKFRENRPNFDQMGASSDKIIMMSKEMNKMRNYITRIAGDYDMQKEFDENMRKNMPMSFKELDKFFNNLLLTRRVYTGNPQITESDDDILYFFTLVDAGERKCKSQIFKSYYNWKTSTSNTMTVEAQTIVYFLIATALFLGAGGIFSSVCLLIKIIRKKKSPVEGELIPENDQVEFL